MFISDQAIIIARKKVASSDIILTLLSANHGKIRIYANRARNSKSKLAADSQLFSNTMVTYSTRKELFSLKEISSINSHSPISEDIGRFYLATYMMELIDKALPEGDFIDGLYLKVEQALTALETADQLLLFKVVADLKLLAALGFEPSLSQCSVCGRDDQLYPILSVSHGGVLCRHCQALDANSIKFSLEDLKMINYLLKKPFATMQKASYSGRMLLGLNRWLNDFIILHLTGRQLKSLQLLETILN